jgi:hypothetical protein
MERIKSMEILATLTELKKFHDGLVSKILDLESESVRTSDLKNFSHFIWKLVNTLYTSSYATFVLALNVILIKQLSPRMGTHRFSLVQLATESDEFFDYFNNTDRVIQNFDPKSDISSLSEHISQLQDLFNEAPPLTSAMKPLPSRSKQKILYKESFADYLECIADSYESFLLLALYFLILFKVLDEQEVGKEMQALRESTKLPVNQLYHNPTKTTEKLLREYLQEFPLEDDLRQSLLEWFDKIFGEEGIRELRNTKIHHYREKQMQFVEQVLEVQFSSGRTQQYSLMEIYEIKLNFQLSVFLGSYVVLSLFYHLLYELLQKEKTSEKKE